MAGIEESNLSRKQILRIKIVVHKHTLSFFLLRSMLNSFSSCKMVLTGKRRCFRNLRSFERAIMVSQKNKKVPKFFIVLTQPSVNLHWCL